MISHMDLIWRSPWEPVSGPTAVSLQTELARELSPGHALFGVKATVLGKRTDNDEVLLSLVNGPSLFAVVHLTWKGQPEPDTQFPAISLFKSAQEGMASD